MPQIQDLALRNLYTRFETAHAANPDSRITEANLVDLLAAIADRTGRGEPKPGRLSTTQARAQLLAAGGDRAKMLQIAKDGLDSFEKNDLMRLLDTPEAQRVPFDESVRNFLAAVVGREPLKPVAAGGGGGGASVGTPDLKVVGDQRNGKVTIKAAPNATIYGLDLSEVVGQRKHVGPGWDDNDWVALGTADAQGNYSATLGGAMLRGLQGDALRLGADAGNGKRTILDIRVDGRAVADTTNAAVNVARIQLTPGDNGSVALSSNDAGREISEPGAKLYFLNTRTNEGKIITLDANGKFNPGDALHGNKGDSFFIAVSDGVNNKGFTTFVTAAGTTDRIQLQAGQADGTGPGTGGDTHVVAEPTLFHDEIDQVTHQPKYQLKKFKGELGPVDPKLAVQGHLGDCYYPSALKTLSQHCPEVVQNAIEIAKDASGNVIKDKDGDPCYVAHFISVDWNDPTHKTPVTVGPFTSELWARSDGSPIYMREGLWGDGDDPDHMQLRYPLLEKAYAIWKGGGSYEGIGAGGLSSNVFQDFTGRIARNVDIGPNDGDKLLALAKEAEAAGRPWSMGTYPESQNAKYTGTGYYADHSYSGMGVATGKPDDATGRGGTPGASGGVEMLKLEQPWNESIPHDLGDGVALITAQGAAPLFQTFMTVEA